MDFSKDLLYVLSESLYRIGCFLMLGYYAYQLVFPLYQQLYNWLYNTIMREQPMRILKHSPILQCGPT